MNWLNDLPVRRKLALAMVITSTIALVVACLSFLSIEYFGYRKSLLHTVETLARVTANSSTAAVAFDDPETAAQNLEALRAEPQITAAVLYDAQGSVLARFATIPSEQVIIRADDPVGLRRVGGNIFAVEPVVENNRRLGTLCLQASMTGVYARMQNYAFGVLCILLLMIGLSWQIASILRRILALPILELANTAKAVSTDQNYSLRARQFGRDELGLLTASFNAMLEKTQFAINALRESEWHHRELVRGLPIAAYMCDAQGRLTVYNDAAATLWGRTPEIGRESWCGSHKIFTPECTPLRHTECPTAVALREGRAVRGVEIIIERPDGTRSLVMPQASPMRDTRGNLTGIVSMLVDVTEQKQADRAARRLAAIVESSDDAIIGKDLNGIITSWNQGAERIFGYTAEQIVGQSVHRLSPSERQDEKTDILTRVRRGEAIKYEEAIRVRQDGSLVDVALTISPIKDAAGRIIGASKIAHDITAQKRTQRQVSFVNQLSHLLSPLSDPDDILSTAAAAVGLHFEVDRCCFATISRTQPSLVLVKDDWRREGFASISGTHDTRDFGMPQLGEALAKGPLAIKDVRPLPLTQNLHAGYATLRIGAHATVPIVRDESGLALLTVATEKPRAWREDELVHLENILSRVWPMYARAHSLAALLESERRLSHLMRALPIACYTIDQHGRLTFFNDAAAQLWGRAPALEETFWCGAVGMTTLEGVSFPLKESPVAVALREKRAVRGTEVYLLRPDGSRRWVVPFPDPLFDSDGNCLGVVSMVMDVTEERTAHIKIQKVADHLSLALAASNLGDWTWDASSDLMAVSDRTAEIYGMHAEPGQTRSTLRGLIHAEDRGRARETLRAALENRTDYNIEYRVCRPDGGLRWVAAKGRCYYDPHGSILGMVGVVQDITERKQQVEALETLSRHIKSQAQLFDTILSNITDLAYAFDLKGNWIYANQRLLEVWGRTFEQIVNKNCYELDYPPELAARIQAQVQQVIDTKRPLRGETPFADARGVIDVHEYSFSPVIDATGKVAAVVGTTRLVTQRKNEETALKRARDEAMAASRAKDDFLAALSHELRTPLNPVLLLASAAAANTELPLNIREDFELIRRNVDLEARLIDDLLDLTRITHGKLKLEQRPCDAQTILKDALANVSAEVIDKRLQLKCRFETHSTCVLGDSVRLQQVFWNLLKNAVKFTPAEGTITLTTRCDNTRLIIELADTGIGMEPEEIARVFKAFSQGEHATNGSSHHRFGGLGLGLAISKMLVELHGGKIHTRSDGRNRGSTFVVELPLAAADRPETLKPTQKTAPRPHSLHPFSANGKAVAARASLRRVLLVEDHGPTRLTLTHLLKRRDFEVAAAKTAAEAQRLAQAGDFALVISDVGLPDRNGYELMAELRALKPDLPGIALSGYGMEDDLVRSRAAGFSVHLVKPITIEVLEDAIARVLPGPEADTTAKPHSA